MLIKTYSIRPHCVSCWTVYILQDDTRTLQCQVHSFRHFEVWCLHILGQTDSLNGVCNPEVEGTVLVRNVGSYLPIYTALQARIIGTFNKTFPSYSQGQVLLTNFPQ